MKGKWVDARFISPGVGVIVCAVCGAWVSPEHCRLHEDWHEKLRLAVDETGTLG